MIVCSTLGCWVLSLFYSAPDRREPAGTVGRACERTREPTRARTVTGCPPANAVDLLLMVFHLTCNLRGARPIARRRTAGVRLIARGRTTCPAVRRCARWVLSQAATTLRTGKRCLPRKWHKWQPEKRRMPTGRVCTFFYYKTRFFWYSSIIDGFPASQKWSTLGSGRAPVFCSHRACRGHAHVPKPLHRTDRIGCR